MSLRRNGVVLLGLFGQRGFGGPFFFAFAYEDRGLGVEPWSDCSLLHNGYYRTCALSCDSILEKCGKFYDFFTDILTARLTLLSITTLG